METTWPARLYQGVDDAAFQQDRFNVDDADRILARDAELLAANRESVNAALRAAGMPALGNIPSSWPYDR